jgi:hypothetical protein
MADTQTTYRTVTPYLLEISTPSDTVEPPVHGGHFSDHAKRAAAPVRDRVKIPVWRTQWSRPNPKFGRS